jgi:hypothetical protein
MLTAICKKCGIQKSVANKKFMGQFCLIDKPATESPEAITGLEEEEIAFFAPFEIQMKAKDNQPPPAE